ncbi:carboxymuconolactone decarboxylase family protein [Pelagibius sp. Alg239-R121]|uniref:carboxymuconolactone decarboxylase family protein n=1 Tax=Pelagibius sp. Alg239-R121 TaxID=2993448 RepID=UPI0024A63FE3|nr:carboxymuconolactone decarboxylase family protein [Pelagibius sp. Alg239-R121]
MASANSINFYEQGADILGALESVEGVIGERGIEVGLHHLILLRASQVNKCGFCVKMHTRDARRDGETDKRLDHLIVWRQVADFTLREKAAFAWTEALTELGQTHDLAALRGELKKHFSDNEISTLTSMIAMINLWNRIQISNH